VIRGVRYLLLIVLSLMPAIASACPKNQHERCLGPFHTGCICVPNIVDPVPHPDIGKITDETLIGAALERWFVASRNSSLNGSMPIPDNYRVALASFVDPRVFNIVRYRIGDNGIINEAKVVQHANGDVSAITLIDVIVFRGPAEAQSICTWAHELTHVKQFLNVGVHSFSVSYVRNPHSQEDEAYGVQSRCEAAFDAGQIPGQ
jgi:hypothetical protein